MTGTKVKNGGNYYQILKTKFQRKTKFCHKKNKFEITYNPFLSLTVFKTHFSMMRKHILIRFNNSEMDKTITEFPLKVNCFWTKNVSLTVFALKILHRNKKNNYSDAT